MNKSTKLFISCLSLGLASYISTAAAADNVVLFKIHDIVPVKNADGNVVSCDIGATFYNRTGSDISNAALNLTWADEVVADAINQEERNSREAQRANRRNTPRYNTASYNSRNISLSLRLPPLKAYQQVTLKSKVVTDRCFLLLNDMDINVSNCGTASEKSALSKNGCNNLFRFVGPKSPEYHSEFKAVSTQEQINQEDSEEDIKKKNINTLYTETVNIISDMSKQLTNNRPDSGNASANTKE